jgi:hypothetical protein
MSYDMKIDKMDYESVPQLYLRTICVIMWYVSVHS